ncbi:MAG: S-layer homology domain-containing protein [Oscillospiraceae bacterium]
MKRRFIPLLLAAALCLGLLTIGAAAEGPYTADDYRFVNVNGTNILNDPDYTVTCGEGKATFDVETATLTIENATLEGSIEIRFEDAAETSTATVILKGQNSMTTRSSGIYTNGNMVVKADAGASLKIEATGEVNGINAWCNLTIDGGTYDVSSGYPAFYSGNDLTIQGGANVVKATATNDSAIYAANKITITGEGTSVNADAYYCAVFGKTGGVTISNGAALVGHSENDHPVYTNGTLLLNGADVTLTSDYAKATALFANSEAPFNIINSKVNVTTDSTSIFSQGNINITDSVLNINSGANPINARGTLSISGSGTVVTANGAYPVAGGEIEISGGSVTVNTTNGTAISGDNGVTISGGSVNASTTAKMSAIYSANGDIEFEGADTKVSASSEQDSAIFTRNGSITLDAGVIEAKSAEGFAPVVARDSDEEEGTGESTSSIIIGENFATGGNIVATTVWKVDDNGNYYADTMLVPADTQLNEDGLLPEDYVPEESEIVVEKLADYSAVDAAVAKAQSLFKGDYVNFDIVERALAAVEYGLGASHQAEVDAMAKAITDAIAELQRIPDLSADTYAISIAASEHGKVSANLSNASAGAVITLTATPDEGYELLSISVRDADGKPVALDGMKFTMPESSVMVTAVFGQGALPFVDVSVNAWYYETVKAAYDAGLMNGVTDTEFAPNATLTRAMIWTILARASGVETEGGATWYAKAQEWVVANGVSDGEDPMGNVTREQLVTMLWRLNGSEVMTGYIGNYIDTGDISEWANQAMLWAVQNGIIEGDENMALAPKADTTRAQAATFFVRYLTVA